jgi:hypothetical protein
MALNGGVDLVNFEKKCPFENDVGAYIFFFFFQNDVVFGGIFKLIFFSKGHFSNLTPTNEVVLYFSSNLTILTNRWG